jgi:hypothetical protein
MGTMLVCKNNNYQKNSAQNFRYIYVLFGALNRLRCKCMTHKSFARKILLYAIIEAIYLPRRSYKYDVIMLQIE